MQVESSQNAIQDSITTPKIDGGGCHSLHYALAIHCGKSVDSVVLCGDLF